MIYSVVIGYFWFGEVPELVVLAGAVIVIAAGLFVIWRVAPRLPAIPLGSWSDIPQLEAALQAEGEVQHELRRPVVAGGRQRRRQHENAGLR